MTHAAQIALSFLIISIIPIDALVTECSVITGLAVIYHTATEARTVARCVKDNSSLIGQTTIVSGVKVVRLLEVFLLTPNLIEGIY